MQLGCSLTALPLASPARSQGWGTKPIRFVNGFAPGGLTDVYCRTYGDHLQEVLGQSVIIDNRAGAGGNLAAMEVKRSAPDGSTLLVAIGSQLSAHRVLYKKAIYDANKDFVKIAYFPAANVPLVVQSSMGVKDIASFVEYARAHAVSIGTPGAGSYAHLTTVELNKNFGLELEPVHYRGETPALNDFMGGSLPAISATWATAKNIIASGKGRAIAVSGTKRMSKLPDVPTFTEQGLKSEVFRLQSYIGVLAPAGMPDALASRYSDLFVEAGKTELVRRMNDQFGNDDSAQGRVAFQKLYDAEAPIWAKLVAGLGLTPI